MFLCHRLTKCQQKCLFFILKINRMLYLVAVSDSLSNMLSTVLTLHCAVRCTSAVVSWSGSEAGTQYRSMRWKHTLQKKGCKSVPLLFQSGDATQTPPLELKKIKERTNRKTNTVSTFHTSRRTWHLPPHCIFWMTKQSAVMHNFITDNLLSVMQAAT